MQGRMCRRMERICLPDLAHANRSMARSSLMTACSAAAVELRVGGLRARIDFLFCGESLWFTSMSSSHGRARTLAGRVGEHPQFGR